ncbi:dihydropteroate synthase [bacterium]|nr:MAG: dihydropteroate synthase [bacterium]
MERIGVDPAGIRIMLDKQFHYNFKVEQLTPAQANVIKQELLSAGGEAAISRGSASCRIPFTDAILSGTLKQFKILIEKLKTQPFGLDQAARDIAGALENILKKELCVKRRKDGAFWTFGRRTVIMGVLNVTPDSFYDGGKFLNADEAVSRGLEMIKDGADWIDIGGQSSRPGALPVTLEEELKRVVPVVEALAKKGVTVSVDTTKAEVARQAFKAGAEIINDISAFEADPDMARVCAEAGAPVVLMHMRGTPETMQKDVHYDDLTSEVFNYLSGRVAYAKSCGIDPESIIIDPGIGFGKSAEGNLELIKNLAEFKTLGRPVLVGLSRKSFISAVTGNATAPAERLSGTLAAGAVAVQNGAHILRVHDVKEAREAATIADALKASRADNGSV